MALISVRDTDLNPFGLQLVAVQKSFRLSGLSGLACLRYGQLEAEVARGQDAYEAAAGCALRIAEDNLHELCRDLLHNVRSKSPRGILLRLAGISRLVAPCFFGVCVILKVCRCPVLLFR